MSKARLIITAVVVEHRSVSEVAKTYGVSRSWAYELVARYRREGEAAFEPRSRRPHSTPGATPAEVVALMVSLRRELIADGLDAGADTIAWHLEHHHGVAISPRTIHRRLVKAGLVVASPKKRPRSSYVRFAAELPNECWQADFTHWRLSDGTDVEILTWLDDHSRFVISCTAHRRVSGKIVVDRFLKATKTHGIPASSLTDNGMVFTTRLSGGRGGRNGYESALRSLGVTQKNSRPNHPTTCGKVERFQQSLKRWLAARDLPDTTEALQGVIDDFVEIYNNQRPHRSLPQRATPAAIYAARPKATAGSRQHDTHARVRHDRVDDGGKVTLRHDGRLFHIGMGRTLARTRIVLLIEDLDVRVVDAVTGELLRALTLDPTRNYQPLGTKPGRPRKKRSQ